MSAPLKSLSASSLKRPRVSLAAVPVSRAIPRRARAPPRAPGIRARRVDPGSARAMSPADLEREGSPPPPSLGAAGSSACEILGVRHAFAVDPERLREAGVVWRRAVTALADALAPALRARATLDDEDPAAAPVHVLELGAGTGALGVGLACAVPGVRALVTDLEDVVPLARRNARDAVASGRVPRGSAVACAALPWREDAPRIPRPSAVAWDEPSSVARGATAEEEEAAPLEATSGARRRPAKYDDTAVSVKETDTAVSSTRASADAWSLVLGCEILYWGGWSLFDEDTRAPLLATMIAACANEEEGEEGEEAREEKRPRGTRTRATLALAFTVRDKAREAGFVLGALGEAFWLRTLGGGGDDPREPGDVVRLDAAARRAVEAASEGDLVLLEGRLKERIRRA